MTRIHKQLTGVLAILLAAGLGLTGCNNQPAPSTSSSASKAPEASQEAPKPQEITEVTWYVEVPNTFPDEQKVFEELNKYTEEKIGVHVNQVLWKSADYGEKMPVIVNSGQKFDICFTAGWGNLFLPNVERGAYADITDLVKQYAPETWETIPQLVWGAATVQGKIYAIPNHKEIGALPGIMINTDIAKECGVDYSNVKTVADWEAILKTVKEKRPDVIGITGASFDLAMPFQQVGGDWQIPAVVRVEGQGDVFAEQGNKVFNLYDTPEFAEFCDMMYRWNQAGYMPDDPVTYDTDSSGRDRDDQAGRLFSWFISYAPGYKDTRAATMGHGVDFVPIRCSIYSGGGGMMAVSATSDNKEKSLEFLNLVTTDKYVGTMVRHGIKDVHYKEVETTDAAGNKYVQCDQFATGFTQDNHPYNYDNGWQFGNMYNQNWVVSYPADIAKQYDAYNSDAVEVPYPGFVADLTNISTEQAAIANVYQQYMNPLVKGAMEPKAGIPQFIKALNDAGMEKYLADIQAQLDAYQPA